MQLDNVRAQTVPIISGQLRYFSGAQYRNTRPIDAVRKDGVSNQYALHVGKFYNSNSIYLVSTGNPSKTCNYSVMAWELHHFGGRGFFETNGKQ